MPYNQSKKKLPSGFVSAGRKYMNQLMPDFNVISFLKILF